MPTPDEFWQFNGAVGRPVFVPQPRLLLGLRLTWPVLVPGTERRWTPGDGPCPGCLGERLGARTFCMVCHRSGIDDLITFLLSQESRRRGTMGRMKAGREQARREHLSRSERRRMVEANHRPGLRGGIGS